MKILAFFGCILCSILAGISNAGIEQAIFLSSALIIMALKGTS